jgi:glycerate-2-kinase
MLSMNLYQQALDILQSAIDAVKPHRLIEYQLSLKNNRLLIRGKESLNLEQFENIYVIGAGKASAFMAQALEELLGDLITGGMVTVKYGHSAACRKITIPEAAHPLPDENGLQATSEILEICKKVGKKDLVFCLISGGGSALLEQLPKGISLSDLQAASQRLLECGATIEEINTIRKHISLVKGGKLARTITPAACLTLIISDVIGDPLESIASGPTVPDTTTFADTSEVIQKYGLKKQLPASVSGYIEKGMRGEAPETLKPGDPVFRRVENIILGNNFTALTAAKKTAETLGFNTTILSSKIRGEAREVARAIAGIVQEVAATGNLLPPPACLLFGGETTVTVRGKGKGGRNQEFALAALLVLQDMPQPHILLSCGTDGTDGPTDAAGAFISPEIYCAARAANLNPLKYLQNNDAYHFFEQVGGLIKTGPTGTNVMDIGIVLIPKINPNH